MFTRTPLLFMHVSRLFHVFFVACTPTVFAEGERREGEREGGRGD